jgi:hypothetical protein
MNWIHLDPFGYVSRLYPIVASIETLLKCAERIDAETFGNFQLLLANLIYVIFPTCLSFYQTFSNLESEFNIGRNLVQEWSKPQL